MLNWFKTKSFRAEQPKTLGELGEELAQEEYKNRGYKIVAANFFNRKGKRLGEIDFIACNRSTVVFVEVKTRARESGLHGTPAEAVDSFKQLKILKAVKTFLLKEPEYAKYKPQIDVAAVIISDFSQLELVRPNPAKYRLKTGLDKLSRFVRIIPNAVEDWN